MIHTNRVKKSFKEFRQKYKNISEIDTDMPKSYHECDEWQFFIDGEPMSDSECRGKLYLN